MNKIVYDRAYESYNMMDDQEIDDKILKFIKELTIDSKDDIEKIINIYNEKTTYEEIVNLIDDVIKAKKIYKEEKKLKKTAEGYIIGTYTTSVGKVLCKYKNIDDCKLMIQYMLLAIKSRNVVVIMENDYKEYDIKHMILMFIQRAFEYYNVDKNLVTIIPYSKEIENEKEYFDLIITEGNFITKPISDKLYIYLENDEYEKDANEAKAEMDNILSGLYEIEIIKGDMNQAIKKINETVNKVNLIFTKEPKKAYRFINNVHAKNVFVNTGFKNLKAIENSEELLFYNKKYIIYPDLNGVY